MLDQLKDLSVKLAVAEVGSCTCLTKTPEVQYHKEHCVYRKIAEALLLLDEIIAEAIPDPALWIVRHNGQIGTAPTLTRMIQQARNMRTEEEQRVSVENFRKILAADRELERLASERFDFVMQHGLPRKMIVPDEQGEPKTVFYYRHETTYDSAVEAIDAGIRGVPC
jgi:hypothetical protein